MTTRRASSEAGFTLVELLIAILAFAIIVPVISWVFFAGLQITDETNKRILDSHDIQSAAAFVNSDVQNAIAFSTTDTTHCVSAAFPVSTPVLYLSWNDLSTEGTTVADQVNYYVSQDNSVTPAKYSLIRSACVSGKTTTIALVDSLSSSTLPSVYCQPSPGTCSATSTSLAVRGKTVSGQFFSLIGTRRTT